MAAWDTHTWFGSANTNINTNTNTNKWLAGQLRGCFQQSENLSPGRGLDSQPVPTGGVGWQAVWLSLRPYVGFFSICQEVAPSSVPASSASPLRLCLLAPRPLAFHVEEPHLHLKTGMWPAAKCSGCAWRWCSLPRADLELARPREAVLLQSAPHLPPSPPLAETPGLSSPSYLFLYSRQGRALLTHQAWSSNHRQQRTFS